MNTITVTKQIYGYARVSRKEQNLDRQLIDFQNLGIPKENIYLEKESGKDFERKQYKKLIRKIKQDDLVIFDAIDRLGRNYAEIFENWRQITHKKRADIKILDTPLLDTTYAKDLLGTLVSDIFLAVLSFAAQNDRDKMLVRQAAGIAAAKQRGVVFGRPPIELPDDFDEIITRWKNKEFDVNEAAKLCKISVTNLYYKINKLKEEGMWIHA